MSDSMNKVTAIVVVAYNRDVSLQRLLTSLAAANYPVNENIPLIISIDKSNNPRVTELAEQFVWKHGEKIVNRQRENLGLKKHVLMCGDLTETYESIIMLEDDLYVAPSFYFYTEAALEFAANKPGIGGISLYSHQLNVHMREPFCAVDDGYDNWYFQFASSWGQAFTKKQWHAFRNWLSVNDQKSLVDETIPQNVSSWSDKSWLKYYIKYLVENRLFFLYPRISLTTNFAEEGTHAKRADSSCDLQVPLAGRKSRDYHFSSLEESHSVYDAFFENICIKKVLREQIKKAVWTESPDTPADETIQEQDIEIDLYGSRPIDSDKRYLLTSRGLPYKVIRTYGRRLRPMEENIIHEQAGEELFLYDRKCQGAAPKINAAGKYLYIYKAIKVKTLFAIMWFRIKQKFLK